MLGAWIRCRAGDAIIFVALFVDVLQRSSSPLPCWLLFIDWMSSKGLSNVS